MKSLFTLIILTFSFGLLAQTKTTDKDQFKVEIPVLWKAISSNEFEFHKEWSYPEGVYENPWGHLSCDGLCPKEVELMKDDQGRIYDDSLEAFYAIVDTTHMYHTIECEAKAYEFVGTDFIRFELKNGDLLGVTDNSTATHSTLYIRVNGDKCTAWIRYTSILPERDEMYFYLENGRIILDPEKYEEGTIKGYFDFRFKNDFEADFPLQWSGYIFSPIESIEN